MLANNIDSASRAPSPSNSCDFIVAARTLSNEPVRNMATAAIAGLAMRLVQREEVRHDPTHASHAEATVAAAGPCISNSRKMKISPAANEFFERGMRTGN